MVDGNNRYFYTATVKRSLTLSAPVWMYLEKWWQHTVEVDIEEDAWESNMLPSSEDAAVDTCKGLEDELMFSKNTVNIVN